MAASDDHRGIVGLDGLNNDILLRFFSSRLIQSEDMVRLALTCRRFGAKPRGVIGGLSLVDEGARQILRREVGGLKRYEREKMEEHEGEPWTKQYYELEGMFLEPEGVNLNHLWCDEAVDDYIARFEKKRLKIGTMMINGPEFHDFSDDEDSEPPSVPECNVERILRSISSIPMPNLRELQMNPSFFSESRDNIILHPSRLHWVLSGENTFKTLSIDNLYVRDQSELVALAKTFSSCTMMKELKIDQLLLCHSVKSVGVLMEALSNLQTWRKSGSSSRLMHSLGIPGKLNCDTMYVQESLSALQPTIEGIHVKQVRRFYGNDCGTLRLDSAPIRLAARANRVEVAEGLALRRVVDDGPVGGPFEEGARRQSNNMTQKVVQLSSSAQSRPCPSKLASHGFLRNGAPPPDF
ncbi:hypothetical protein THAOC_08482 [Thalassiosira oceanica]|uniref:Uncharacterized protein n=1 Tax=Thalassiosira oceanica TaxID=159749 RepID=K0T9Z6_THAOC|nr:hypothetical protein THAOC_08482 [Thalassiosira oceanica]|eukprot:EJK70181.1 hypothetical protein THAOC_08482 [Thalassiosira oceanica]